MNPVSEQIDERILRLLGLEDVFDLDYDTYMTLLKEAIVVGKDKIPQEELAILANERKRIRGKTGRFKPKKEKITADKIATTKFFRPTKKTSALLSSISKPDSSQNLIGVGKPLESIANTLAAILKFNKKTNEEERKEKESQKRTKREEGLEGFKRGVSAVSGAAKKMLAPFQSIIDRIWRFIFFTLLGRAFTQLMDWLGDPANKRKIEVLGRFLKDWWPALAFAAGLFLTPFGKFIRTTIGALRTFFPQMLVLLKSPAFLAVAGSAAAGVAGASLESNLKKVDETLLQRKIKEAKDQGKPLSKQEIEKIKLENLQKRVEDVRGTNIPGSALLASGGVVPRFSMGGINPSGNYMNGLFDTGYEGIDNKTGQRVSGFGPDTQAIIAQPGEIVMNKKTVDAMGPGYFLGLNRTYGGPGANKPKMGKLYNAGGMVGEKLNLTDNDYKELAFIVSAESRRGTDDEYAVAAVVLNRLASPSWPNSIRSIGKQPGQFDAVEKGKAYYDENLAAKLKANQPKIIQALTTLNGRDSFKGQSEIDYKGSSDIMFNEKGNFFHYRQQVSKTDPVPKQIDKSWKNLIIKPKEPKEKSKTEKNKIPNKKGFWANFASMMPTSLPFRGGGLIKENTGMNIPGATADRQLAALQPGEYVLPAGTVSKLGVPLIDMMVAMTDYDSTPAKLGKKPVNRPTITPLSRTGKGGVMTLPPITQSVGGSMMGSSAAGSKVPSFSAVSPSAGEERSNNASIYGIIG